MSRILSQDQTDQVYFEKINSQTFEATTLDGTVYQFGDVETASADMPYNYSGKTYKVSRIDLLSGRFITFSYADETYYEQAYSESAEIVIFAGLPVTTAFPTTYHTKKRLAQIVSTDAIINFNAGARDDINTDASSNVKRLSSIDVVARLTNQKVKSFLNLLILTFLTTVLG